MPVGQPTGKLGLGATTAARRGGANANTASSAPTTCQTLKCFQLSELLVASDSSPGPAREPASRESGDLSPLSPTSVGLRAARLLFAGFIVVFA